MSTPTQQPETAANLAGVPEDACNTCGQLWPVDELELDANLDLVCTDCAITGAGVLDSDAAAYRSYMYAGR